MKKSVLIGGGTGLIGKRLTEMLVKQGFVVHILSRSKHQSSDQIKYHQWDLSKMTIDSDATDVDYIINLTGAGIADARWTEKRKKILIDSRVDAAKLILKNIQENDHRPKAYISASAVGYYGDRGEEVLTELSTVGDEFMSRCCKAWEDAAFMLKPVVDRHVINRIGIVMSTQGGALPKVLMTKPILSYFGDGNQYYPWIHIDDVCKIFVESITDERISGIYNAVAPEPLTNKKFTKEIKEATGGIMVPAPTFALRLAMGEMANVILNSNRVIPKRLQDHGHHWEHSDLTAAVKDLKGRGI